MNGDEKSINSFFQQFRKLASNVDHLLEEYKQAVNDKTNQDFCAPQVCKTISDMRNELKQLKIVAQHELEEVNKSIPVLDGMLAAGNDFISSTRQQLEQTEQYLGQYGYKSYDEVHGTKQTSTVDTGDNVEEEGNDETMEENTVVEGPKTPTRTMAPPKDVNRTPQLEDFGLSEVTLQIMKSVQKEKPAVEKPSVPRPEWSNVPSIFHHDGIICTPSLTRSLDMNSTFTDLHTALASPTHFPGMSEMSTIPEADSNPSSLKYPKLESSQRSHDLQKPVPSMSLRKTEEQSSQSAPLSTTRPVNISLFKTEEANKTMTKPKPVGMSAMCYGDDDMEPAEPDLTFSLEALTEMTGVFKINPLLKPPTTTVKPCTPLPANDDKENATPPEPKLLTDQMSRLKSNLPKTETKTVTKPDIDIDKYMCDDMPPSPKLLGNYDFLK